MFIKKKNINFNYIINVKNKILGRNLSFISKILTGKNKKTEDYFEKNRIKVININKIFLDIKKKKKIIYKHSKYPGGLKIKNFKELYNKFPNKIFKKSIKNMLNKNKKRKLILKKIFFMKEINLNNKLSKNKILNIL